jgi:hypothetical protein
MSAWNSRAFMRRWSSRKLDPPARRREDYAHAGVATSTESAPDERFANFDFDALNFESDYRQFMSGTISDQIRNKALQKLWNSSDLIAKPDELDEYREDFRDEAKSAGIVGSAYRIGGALLDEDDSHNDEPMQTSGERDQSAPATQDEYKDAKPAGAGTREAERPDQSGDADDLT